MAHHNSRGLCRKSLTQRKYGAAAPEKRLLDLTCGRFSLMSHSINSRWYKECKHMKIHTKIRQKVKDPRGVVHGLIELKEI